VAVRSKAWVCCLLACWDCGFESRRGARMSVSGEYCVLSGIVLCVRLITRLEESYRVCICRDREASIMRRSWRCRAHCSTLQKSRISRLIFTAVSSGFCTSLYRILRVWRCCLQAEILVISWKLVLNFEALNCWLQGSPFGRLFLEHSGLFLRKSCLLKMWRTLEGFSIFRIWMLLNCDFR
jgi:hypothetical protein